jgi:hypothetical protein
LECAAEPLILLEEIDGEVVSKADEVVEKVGQAS